MTSPQSDPAQDVGAALARLAEQATGLQRQALRLQAEHADQVRLTNDAIRELEARITQLTDAKFVTFRALIDGQADRVALALDAAKEAIDKADSANEKRFDAVEKRFSTVNEFRGQLADQARTFMPRTEATQLADQATQRIRDLADLIPTLATRMEVNAAANRSGESVADIKERLTRLESEGKGAKDNRAALIGWGAFAISILIATIALFNFLSTR